MREFKPGIWKHFKGGKYIVLGLANHSETLEKMVIYIGMYENPNFPVNMWVRPLENFLEYKEINGKKVPKFEFVGDFTA